MRAILPVLATVLLAGPAFAQGVTSHTTRLEKCRVIDDDGEVGDYTLERCPGLAGARVYMDWSASHTTLSFRWGKAKSGGVVTGYGLGGTLEWRALKSGRGFAPYAIIVRVKLRDDNMRPDSTFTTNNVLAVIRMEKRNACLMAAIDEAANPNALALARTTADAEAAKFACAKGKPKIVGKPSRWAQQAIGYDGEPPK